MVDSVIQSTPFAFFLNLFKFSACALKKNFISINSQNFLEKFCNNVESSDDICFYMKHQTFSL